jgi:hypothetical protein
LVLDPSVDELVKAIRKRELRVEMVEQIGDSVSFIAEEPLPLSVKRTGGHYRIRVSDVQRAIELVCGMRKPHNERDERKTQLKVLDILNKIELEACT